MGKETPPVTPALRRVGELRTLVDIDLRDQSGLDVARRLHHDDDVALSRLILISTPAEEDYAELIAASPTTGFLPKAELSVGATRALLGRADDGGQVSGRRGT
jgi:hypothetical protein